mmetsp:Transcript_13501/g.18016  ORF Transcript_13501/g.18016 Transcript_13501/m.18016 type:complete len:173 (-) Transcript_13501:226-744(-)
MRRCFFFGVILKTKNIVNFRNGTVNLMVILNFKAKLFFCAEQAMMASKAKLFNDYEIRTEIMKEKRSPRRCKELGRKVKNFDIEKWDTKSLEIVTEISYAKFSQNERLKRLLLSSGDKILAEASPYDKVWGIGLKASDPRAHNCKTWCGENKLGIALMNARQMIRSAKYTAQ